MTAIETLLSQPIMHRLGWSLLHFVWQGTVMALGFAAILGVLRHRSPAARHAVGCVVLLVMALLPAFTMMWVGASGPAGAAVQGPTEAAAHLDAFPPEAVGLAESGTLLFPGADDRSGSGLKVTVVGWWRELSDLIRPHLSAVVAVWLLGVVALSVRNLVGWLAVRRLRQRFVEPAAARWRDRLEALSQRLGIRGRVGLFVSHLAESPAVIGWVRPVVLLPLSALTGLTEAQIESLLAHELAHIRRYDCLVNLIQTAIETLLFYHPAVWWVSRQIRIEREYCCDELAVSVSGDRLSYARALATLEEQRARQPFAAVAATGGVLVNRIRRLVGMTNATGFQAGRSVVAGVVLIAVLGLAIVGQVTSAVEQDTKGSDDTERPREMLGAPLALGELRVVSLRFEPIHQGKNVVHVDVESPADGDQLFGIHVYTRSPKLAKRGMGWGRSWDPFTIGKSASKTLRLPFKIHGPITEQTWLRLKLWHLPSPVPDRWWNTSPGASLKYANGEFPQRKGPEPAGGPARPTVQAAVMKAFAELQELIKARNYDEAWRRFTSEYQMVEFSRFDWFKRGLEGDMPMRGFSWPREDLLELKPQSVGKVGKILRLRAIRGDQTWTIDFVQADGKWKVDWIGGYEPPFARPADRKSALPDRPEKRNSKATTS